MTSRLEQRYRGLLTLLLPRWYREKRADEMVDVFISGRQDDIDQEYGWPGWREAGAVAALGVRTRLSGPDGPPRAAALGDTVRLVAMLGLLASAVMSVGEVGRWAVANLFYEVPQVFWFGRLQFAGMVAAVGAFALMFTRWRGLAKAMAVVAVVPGLIGIGQLFGADDPVGMLWMVGTRAPLWVATVCLFVGFHREAPAPPRKLWLVAAPIGAAVAIVWDVLPVVYSILQVSLAVDPWTVQTLAVIVAGVVVLLRASQPHTRLALAICAALLVPQQIVFGYQLVRMAAVDSYVAVDFAASVALIEVFSLLLVGIALVIPGVRGYRRLVT